MSLMASWTLSRAAAASLEQLVLAGDVPKAVRPTSSGSASWRSVVRELRKVTTLVTSCSLSPMVRRSSASNIEGPILPRYSNRCLDFLPNPRNDETDNPGFATVKGVTTSSRTLAAAWLSVAVLGLSACGGDDDEPEVDPRRPPPARPGRATASDSADPCTDPSTDPSDSADPSDTASVSPTVAPATGIELREETSSVRVPEKWRAAPPIASYQSGATGPAGAGTIDLLDVETLNPGTALEDRVKAAMTTLPKGAKVTRLPDVMLGGDTPAYHLTYTKPDSTEVTDIVETERNGQLVTMDFYLSADALEKDPDIVASVLATFQWVG